MEVFNRPRVRDGWDVLLVGGRKKQKKHKKTQTTTNVVFFSIHWHTEIRLIQMFCLKKYTKSLNWPKCKDLDFTTVGENTQLQCFRSLNLSRKLRLNWIGSCRKTARQHFTLGATPRPKNLSGLRAASERKCFEEITCSKTHTLNTST